MRSRHLTTLPAVDQPDLAPATRKRKAPEPTPVEPAAAPLAGADDLAARVHAIESAVRAVDVRLELVERMVRTGFQEAASRDLVLSEATEEALRRLEARVAGVDTAPTVQAVEALRAQVELVAERLSTLLGGPTLTELLDRIDEIADVAVAEPKKRRKRD